ncbi:zinc finger protein 862-like [Centruroides vittatus]|uniref:zinc finger protein 862-like n=1 Tax=Centruroides vittatus TaxID=120091 RepID=UPI00350FAB1C
MVILDDDRMFEKTVFTYLAMNTSSVNGITEGRKRKFQISWLQEFNWLSFDTETGLAKCNVCTKFPNLCKRNSKLVQGFRSPFKHETFKFHDKSGLHQKCLEALLKQDTVKPAAMCTEKINQETFHHMSVLFNIVYYIMKNGKPFSEVKDLLCLAKKLRTNMYEQKENEDEYKTIASYIAQTIKKNLIDNIKLSDFVSLLIDDCTDSTVEEIILYIKYFNNNNVVESFLGTIPLQKISADDYLEAIDKEFFKLGLNWRNNHWLVGVGTNSTVTVINSMKNMKSHLITIPCITYDLHIQVLKSAKEVPYISFMNNIIINILKFYQNCPKRLKTLQTVAPMLQTKILKIQIFDNYWLICKTGFLKALLADWETWLIHLESIENENCSEYIQIKEILKVLKDFRFILTIHFLLDFLPIFKQLSYIFQKHLLVSQIKIHVNNVLCSLKKLGRSSGFMEENFMRHISTKGSYKNIPLIEKSENKDKFQSDRNELIQIGIKFINNRFLDIINCEVANACCIFDTFTWPSDENLKCFGEEEIKCLGCHFNSILSIDSAETVNNLLLNEWREFKMVGQNLRFDDLVDRIRSQSERFPFLSKLLSIVAILPTASITCKRGWSEIKSIQSVYNENFSDVLMVKMNGPELECFQPESAIDKWYFDTQMNHLDGYKHYLASERQEQ